MLKCFTSRKSGLLLALLLFSSAAAFTQTSVYNNPIAIPPLLDGPSGVTLLLNAKQALHNFDPASGTTSSNPFYNVPTWTFSQDGAGDTLTYLGPTLHWWTGDQASVWTTNNVGTDTFTTIHWHGLELPARDDGGPHEWVPSGTTNIVEFPVLDSASTNWFHPHLHDNTYGQVEKGLASMIIIDQFQDSIREQLPSTYGVDDIPLIIQDRAFNTGTTPYTINSTKGAKHPWNVVNGVIHPYVEVPESAMVRFRILNGSGRKGIRFALAADTTSNNFIPFWVVGTDGGYTMTPESVTSMTMGPGERLEIVMDFTNANASDTFYLRNLASTMPSYIVGAPAPGPNGGGGDVTQGKAFMAIRFKTISGFNPVTTTPSWNRNWNALGLANSGIYHSRVKYLVEAGPGVGYVISDTDSVIPSGTTPQQFMAANTFQMGVVNDVVCEGNKEKWTIVNKSNVAHPFHIHKVFFRVVSIDSNGVSIPIADRGLDGPKDDIFIYPNWRVSFIATFDDYGTTGGLTDTANAYMYHCHILTHEDSEGGGMMHQFVVNSNPCTPIGVGTAGTTVKDDMAIFPNPAGDVLYLRGISKVASTIEIFDVMGRRLKVMPLGAFDGTVQIDTNGLPRGLVLVSWHSPKGKFSRKILLD